MATPVQEFYDKYDLILYIANLATKSNQTVVRLEWAEPMGADVPVYMHSIPTVFVSLEKSVSLLDVPRVRTFINTYGSTEEILDALVEKLSGQSKFCGKSPVDAFCGKWETRCNRSGYGNYDLKINRTDRTLGIDPDDVMFSFKAGRGNAFTLSLSDGSGRVISSSALTLADAVCFRPGVRLSEAASYIVTVVSECGDQASLAFERRGETGQGDHRGRRLSEPCLFQAVFPEHAI